MANRTKRKGRLDKAALFDLLGYTPHEGQQRVHDSKAKRRVVACGVRFGKSTFLSMLEHYYDKNQAQHFAALFGDLDIGRDPTQKRNSPYTPIRFVPVEKVSKHHRLMLAFDAVVLWKASGQMPTKGTIIHGFQHRALVLKLDAWIHEVESLIGKLRTLLTDGSPPDPVLIQHCKECPFEADCRKKVTEKDDLSLLDGLGTTDRAKLNAKGIFTVTQLAYTFRPRRRPKHQASRSVGSPIIADSRQSRRGGFRSGAFLRHAHRSDRSGGGRPAARQAERVLSRPWTRRRRAHRVSQGRLRPALPGA